MSVEVDVYNDGLDVVVLNNDTDTTALTLILKVLLHWLVNCTIAKSTSKIFYTGVNRKDDQVPMLLNQCQEEDVEDDEEEHIVFIGDH